MEVIIIQNKKEENGDEQEIKEIFDIAPDDDKKTLGDIRKEFAARRAIYEERFRLVTAEGEIMHDTAIVLKHLKDYEDKKSVPGSDDGSEKDAKSLTDDEDVSPKEELSLKAADEGDKEEPVDRPEKGKLDSSEEEKSSNSEKADLILKVIDKCLGDEDKVEKKIDHALVRQEILTVMRMNREHVRFPMTGSRVTRPRTLRLFVEEEEVFPIFLYSESDGVKYLACRSTDTFKRTKERFAKLYDVPTEQFKMYKDNPNETTDPNMTLDELQMREGHSFKAWRTGTKKMITIFGFSVCAKFKVDFDKPIQFLKANIESTISDLNDVKFYLWYNGMRIPDEDDVCLHMSKELGKVFLGTHYLRVMIDYDPTVAVTVDTGPDMVVKKPPRGKPIIKRMRRTKDGKFVPVPENETEEERRKREEEEALRRGIHLTINKRALRYFDLIVECHLVENILKDPGSGEANGERNGAVHEPPLTLTQMLPNMRLHELKRLIARKCKEGDNWENQVLYLDGGVLGATDDHKTLRELGIVGSGPVSPKVLYKEPGIKIKVNVSADKTVELKLAGYSTTFNRLACILEKQKDLQLRREDVRLLLEKKQEGGDTFFISVFPNLMFSDYDIKDGDILHLVRPVPLRVWYNCYAYDKDVFVEDCPSEIKEWIAKETEIAKDDQLFTKVHSEQVDITTHVKECHDRGVKCEVEVFDKKKLPDRLMKETSVSGFGNFIESREDEDDDSDEGRGATGGQEPLPEDEDDEDDEDVGDD